MEKITTDIRKETENGWEVDVTIEEDEGSTHHTITLSRDYLKKLADDNIEPERLIRASFAFLLERESKESILTSFDLSDIEDYFPDYPDRIGQNL